MVAVPDRPLIPPRLTGSAILAVRVSSALDLSAQTVRDVVAVPENAQALLIFVAFVLPGIVYQSVWSRMRGPTPGELNATTKILRAFAVSTVLVLAYAVVLGPTLVEASNKRGWLYDNPRGAAALGIVFLFVVPAGLAVGEQLWGKWPNRPHWDGWERLSQYDPTPTAWDFAFRDREPCFLRLLTDDGRWVGGWFDPHSFASSFPQPRELFIAREWVMDLDGEFIREVTGSRGVYVRCDDVRAVEFLADQERDTTALTSETRDSEPEMEAS